MIDEKKFLDQAGVQYLWSQLSLEDYPNNETLIAVLNAIDTTKADKEDVQSSYEKLKSNTVLGFYCIEDVTVITNGVSKLYPANSNVQIRFAEDDIFEIVTTSDNSILSLTAFPGALGTYYSWLEGVRQFSNILFDMNNEEFYSKWSQGNQGAYQVQYAQYLNCIFWSDNPYINDVAKRTNYTLYNSSQLPLCYSSIPDNTFKAFYLALGVNSDPNWSNPAYIESFAKATWATQVFSYYGARVIGLPEHFTITLPKDCRGLMFYARNTEAAGTFDAANVTNFGAKSGSWRDAFGYCSSLRRLYISNLKVNLNVSWSPIDYESIYYIISEAANTSTITISVSPYTYNLLSPSDFDLAASKNITIELISTNYIEDKRLGEIANKVDKNYVDNQISNLVNSAPETLDTLGELAAALNENKDIVDILNASIVNKQNKNVIVYRDSTTKKASMTAPQIMEKVRAGENVYYTTNLSGGTLHPYLEGADTAAFFYSNYIDNDRVVGNGILISADGTITQEVYQLEHLTDTIIHITSAERNRWNDTYTKTETDDLLKVKTEDYVKKYFLIVETTKQNNNYLLDGITFDEILEKFNTGNVNMVCHVDGTDYIPLLSVTPYSIIFSGIYNTTSVSLVFNTEGVGTLSTTYLCDRSSLTTHTSDKDIHITSEERDRWNNTYTKAEVDNLFSAPVEYNEIILKSSVEGSSKKFRLTIDDDGVLSTEEVV